MLNGNSNSEKIWNYFLELGMSKCGIAGLIGNLDCESGLDPYNLEDAYERKLGYSNASYASAVDSGMYNNFVRDCAGWGLAQWTWWTRKQSLLNFAKSKNKSIGDLEMQLDFLVSEMKSIFPSVWNTLMSAKSVREASNVVLLGFEQPLDQSVAMQDRRCATSQSYYNTYASAVKKESVVSTSMGYIIVQKGSNKRLSNNFTSNEFDCHGSGCCTQTRINEKLVTYLQMISDHFKSVVTITSAFRCPTHNSSPTVKGATGSRHTIGDAADIVVANHTPREVAAYAESAGILGIGLYETASDGHFVHIDTRDYKSFWYGQACAPRTTFANLVIAQSSGTPTNSANPKYIMYGNSGSAVKELQTKLIKLGFDCGAAGADGSFGLGTLNAVKAFQKDAGFAARDIDGIVGDMTMKKINEAISKIEKKDKYVVTASALNVRSGGGLNNSIVKVITKGTELTITEIKDGWGKSDIGWVSMQYLQQEG